MEVLSYEGSTGVIYRLGKGLVAKMPWPTANEHHAEELEKAFNIEQRILEHLSLIGAPPGIIAYHGPCMINGRKEGLLLSEANCGDLQAYIDRENVDETLRRKWSLQIAHAVAYIHENGIVHMNLSTSNVLLHRTGQSMDAILADFGGSRCAGLGLYGDLLPDSPFLDPRLVQLHDPSSNGSLVSLPKVDVFSLGVVIYTIMTGHYPFREGPAPGSLEENHAYNSHVQSRYRRGEFPDLSEVYFGDVIAGCCCERRFNTAKEVVAAMEAIKYK
ncbi:kinase-like protein [Bimuria novae-zelandiae CBS 107.79]|uniref:Kinase-like protein n=1 Tax=Bimuria novae-zelandiae CBS 107.79 TaxID=1447943 RepID=A0A6A5VBG1_9PLEO|nr:kinase-like protein [Bimuria novae-zelandiae CBS 107.79]